MEKQYITLSLDELVPYENNPRLNDDAVADVMESIKQTGNNDPIEIDENNVILSGHTRLKALKQLGYTQTECLRISGMTEEQKKEISYTRKQDRRESGLGFGKAGAGTCRA